MTNISIFEAALRGKFRFPSPKGELTVENLFDLPLTSRTGLDLDSIAKAINAELKKSAEESFVEAVSPRNQELFLKLEIVKNIIKSKQDEAAERRRLADRNLEIERLESLLARKQEAALESLPAEEIEKRLRDLRG